MCFFQVYPTGSNTIKILHIHSTCEFQHQLCLSSILLLNVYISFLPEICVIHQHTFAKNSTISENQAVTPVVLRHSQNIASCTTFNCKGCEPTSCHPSSVKRIESPGKVLQRLNKRTRSARPESIGMWETAVLILQRQKAQSASFVGISRRRSPNPVVVYTQAWGLLTFQIPLTFSVREVSNMNLDTLWNSDRKTAN